jgi:hypothetical protein
MSTKKLTENPSPSSALAPLVLLLAACGPSPTRANGNGAYGELTLERVGDGAVGELYSVYITDGHVRTEDCNFDRNVYGIPVFSCSGVSDPVTDVLDVSCEGVGCTVVSSTVATGGYVTVVLRATQVGTARLRARVRVESSEERADEWDVRFHTIDGLTVECRDTGAYEHFTCPGRYGVFVGTQWSYVTWVHATDDGMPVTVDVRPQLTLEGDALAMVYPGTQEPSFMAMASGTSQIRLVAGAYEWTTEVHVAQPEDVTAVALRRDFGSYFDRDPTAVRLDEEPLPTTIDAEFPHLGALSVVSTLADGALVLGGPATVTISQPFVTHDIPSPTPPGWWQFQLSVGGTGEFDVTVTMGNAVQTTTFTAAP